MRKGRECSVRFTRLDPRRIIAKKTQAKRRPNASDSGLRWTRTYAENDEPQPQVLVALGFLITNCAPSRPSV